jgi:hypothetical protein
MSAILSGILLGLIAFVLFANFESVTAIIRGVSPIEELNENGEPVTSRIFGAGNIFETNPQDTEPPFTEPEEDASPIFTRWGVR